MTRYQVGIWIFCLVAGLSIGIILNQPDFYALLAFTLLAYPAFCNTVNWISQKIIQLYYNRGNDDIQTD